MAEDDDNLSPYVYAVNNPILMNDPDGISADSTQKPKPQAPIPLKEVIVKSIKNNFATIGAFVLEHGKSIPKPLLAADAVSKEIPVVDAVLDVVTAGYVLYDLTKDHMKFSKTGTPTAKTGKQLRKE